MFSVNAKPSADRLDSVSTWWTPTMRRRIRIARPNSTVALAASSTKGAEKMADRAPWAGSTGPSARINSPAQVLTCNEMNTEAAAPQPRASHFIVQVVGRNRSMNSRISR